MPDTNDTLREIAGKWLADGTVEAVLGWTQGSYKDKTTPVLINEATESYRLIFNERCTNNLMVYLKREPIKNMKSVGIVAKGCDIKSFIGLMQESQVARERVKILAVTCGGVKNKHGSMPAKCGACDVKNPALFDAIAGDKVHSKPDNGARCSEVNRLENMTQPERYGFWRVEFDRCIRCYACRQACPLCTCERCIAEKNQPQWIETSAHSRGNFAWNVIRAYHMAGRCVECEAQEFHKGILLPAL